MQFATPPKITLSHWLFFLGYVPFLKLRLVLKLSDFYGSVPSAPPLRSTAFYTGTIPHHLRSHCDAQLDIHF